VKINLTPTTPSPFTLTSAALILLPLPSSTPPSVFIIINRTAQYLKGGPLFFSRDSPNFLRVIPTTDKIDNNFTQYLKDNNLNVAIRAAIISAKATLNKYYELTDHAEVYRIAMGE